MKYSVVAFIVILGLAGAAFGAEQDYYLYQYGTFGTPGDLTVAAESAYGTRETRLLGKDVYEQSLRARVAGTSRLSVEVWGGLVTNDQQPAEETGEENGNESNSRNSSFSGDLYGRLLKQDDQGIDLSVGLGYLNDYQATSIPRARLIVSREFDDWDITGSVLAEVPLGGEEEAEEAAAEGEKEFDSEKEEEEESEAKYDEVDLSVSLASSYRFTDWFRLGAEAGLEDMEGFWEEEEAEGGAKSIVGPTASFIPWKNMSVRMNLAAVIPITMNSQTRVPNGTDRNGAGFLGRLAVGYTF
jgi:hypothetical protein